MDGQRFDDLARLFSASLNRKRLLILAGGIMAPAGLAASLDGAAAKKKGKKGKNRKGRDVGVGGEGGENPVCAALCTGSVPDPQFCGSFGNCGDDADCIAQNPERPICCTSSPGCGGAGEGACCAAPSTCGGSCDGDGDCDGSPNCVCDLAEGVCQTVICGGRCEKGQCPPVAGCVCENKTNECVTATCGGDCDKGECPEGDGCVCNTNTNECVTVSCPGSCEDNEECREQGQGNCVCSFGPGFDVRSASDFQAEGENGGFCSSCGGAGDPCFASTECCGQLVCEGAGGEVGDEGIDSGVCRRKSKPKPKDRCSNHGGNCQRDNDCCAQAVCFKGKCGEKDTHCKNNSECAQGYSCQGGPLAPGHRRCRKNGRRNRNRRNKNGQKR